MSNNSRTWAGRGGTLNKHATITKDYEAEITVSGNGEVSFYAAVFSNVDLVGDICIRGCFKKSLKAWSDSGDPIPVVFSHDWDNPMAIIGYADPDDCVEDEHGLLIRAKLDVETNPVAAQVYSLMQRRVVREASFAYETVREERVKTGIHKGANALLELNIFEVGPCLKGANPMTDAAAPQSAKSWQSAALRNINEWCRSLGIVPTKSETARLTAEDAVLVNAERDLAVAAKALSDRGQPFCDDCGRAMPMPAAHPAVAAVRFAVCSNPACPGLTVTFPDDETKSMSDAQLQRVANAVHRWRADHLKAIASAAQAEEVREQRRTANTLAEIERAMRRKAIDEFERTANGVPEPVKPTAKARMTSAQRAALQRQAAAFAKSLDV